MAARNDTGGRLPSLLAGVLATIAGLSAGGLAAAVGAPAWIEAGTGIPALPVVLAIVVAAGAVILRLAGLSTSPAASSGGTDADVTGLLAIVAGAGWGADTDGGAAGAAGDGGDGGGGDGGGGGD